MPPERRESPARREEEAEAVAAEMAAAEMAARAANGDREIPMRMVTERVLLSALRELDAAALADAARKRAEFLADASLRLGSSLDEELTHAAIAALALPGRGTWCIVDLIEVGGGHRRLALVHPDEGMQAVARDAASPWTPAPGDPIGIPAVARDRRPVLVQDGADAVLAAAARDPDTLRVLRWLGAGSLIVVPIVAHDVMLGAITFVSRPGAVPFAREDVRLAEALAARCAQALEASRLYAAARAARADADAARAEADLANASKARLLRTMSHELRTPLNAIAGYAQLMELEVHGPVTPEQMQDLRRIQASQRHLLELVDELLTFAQIETGSVRYDVADVRLHEVLTAAEALVAPQADAKALALSVDECAADLIVRADPSKFRQILLNLLGNAVKFTPTGGRVRATCVAAAATVAVVVEDTGVGIEPGDLDRIFEPFVQVDQRLGGADEGIGLGLAISRDFARGMGGDLTVESTPATGSRFTVTLPRA